MIVLKAVTALLGLAFATFGYFIFFRKKYSLINGFEEALRNGQKTELYARRIGLVELVLGIAFLIASLILIAFC